MEILQKENHELRLKLAESEAEVKRFNELVNKYHNAVNKFIHGEPLSEDETSIERKLHDYRQKEQERRATMFASTNKGMPSLTVGQGSSGLEIRAKLPKSYNCQEFTTREDSPQPIFISPWIQFEPVDLAEERLKLGMEIARRAMYHDHLSEKVKSLQSNLEGWQDTVEKREEEIKQLVEDWRAERVKYGLKADFSDFKKV